MISSESRLTVPRIPDILFRFGTLLALLLMCLLLSLLTLSKQYPSGEAAARQVAKRLRSELSPSASVLVVTGANPSEREYGSHLQEILQKEGYQVQLVAGDPVAARKKLVAIAARGEKLDAIATSHTAAAWRLFRGLGEDFPQFARTRLVQPESYIWPNFLKTQNLLNVANQISVIAIIAVGMTFVIIAGGIDLSVGSLIALASVVAALLIRDYGGGVEAGITAMVTASVMAIIVGGLVGLFSGTTVVLLDIPPFIVTLAMMLVASGMAYILSDGNSVQPLPESYVWLGRGANLFGVPNTVVLMLLTFLLAHIVLARTVFGRYVYAVGDNRQAAWLSGVPVKRVIASTYVAAGALAGVGGVVFASNYQSGDPRYGEMYELYVIAAVVVGGTSLSGGRGTVFGTLLGALIIGVINNGMNLLGITSFAQKVILGFVILGAVLLDQLAHQRLSGRRAEGAGQ